MVTLQGLQFKIRGFTLFIYWSALVMIALTVILGVASHSLLGFFEIQTEFLPTVLGVAVTYASLALVHELGHVLGFKIIGMKLDFIHIGLAMAVSSSSTRKVWHQFVISSLGPLAQILAGIALVLILKDQTWAIGIIIAAWLSVFEGAVNLLLVTSKRCDAAKFYKTLYGMARGRAQEQFDA